MAKYCSKCHSGTKPKAGLDLEKYKDDAAVLKDLKTWEKILDQVDAGEMPPEGKPKPSDKEAETITRWITLRLKKSTCQGQPDPGRVTLRRLNRAEYNNTIRDLIGIDFKPAEDFPSDDVGYGFDNIGDVLTTPPILMEKYLAAAEGIADRAIVADGRLDPPVRRREAEEMSDKVGGAVVPGKGRILTSNGAITLEHNANRDGKYGLRIRAYGDQAGDELVKMTVRYDGRDLGSFEVSGTEERADTYEVRFDAPRGRKPLEIVFTNDYYQPDDPDPKKRGDRNLYVDWVEFLGPINVDKALPEPHRRIVVRTPKSKEELADCACEVLTRFTSRAYRRPARPEDIAPLVKLVEMAVRDGERFERGIQLAVQAVLASPHFLFRVEIDRDPKAAQAIDEYELASRLSYFLWSSMPDDELLRLAAQSTLHRPEMLHAQVDRMLKDSKSRALVENFAGQWLQIRNLKTVNPDPGQFPSFNETLRSAMQRETELFFEAIVKENRSILDFVDADFTFLNERLAKHYGIEGVSGDEFRRVTLSGDRRGGILTMASVLTITSNPTRTSPVKRGKWILEQVLGAPPPPPPPDVPELADGKDVALKGSLRQRMEQHRANPNCAVCHAKLDPLGFGFENYDATGAWRDKDGAFEVDPSGTLPSGESFKGPKELKAILKGRQKEFARCLTEKLMTYALGRGLEFADRCAVDSIIAHLESDNFRFSRLVREIVMSDPFLKRGPRPEDVGQTATSSEPRTEASGVPIVDARLPEPGPPAIANPTPAASKGGKT